MRLIVALLASLIALAGLAAPVHAQTGGAIDFGDNTSPYASNGKCDDPRFEGTGMAAILIPSDRRHDSQDCAAGVAAGKLTYRSLPPYLGKGSPPTIYEIDFGDDASSYARDESCDDSRFGGRMMASILIDEDIGHDATDCLIGVSSGELIFLGSPSNAFTANAPVHAPIGRGETNLSGVDFGDDDSAFAFNEECDDRRFSGEGMAEILIDDDIGHDATDCEAASREGTVTYQQVDSPASADGIDYGDDASSYANNGECDDTRFDGEGMAIILIGDDVGHDATDCRTLMEEGSIEYIGDHEGQLFI